MSRQKINCCLLYTSRPGMYGNAWDGDIASQHPSSAIAEVLFGVLYTKRFEEIKEARVAIKHHDYAKARTMLDGALVEYIDQLENGTAWFTAEDLAQALKIVINSVYGLTAANFENPFRDPRNKDNIVAKRGALFMTLLKSEVEKRGFCVAHIKTDSIKKMCIRDRNSDTPSRQRSSKRQLLTKKQEKKKL